MQRAALARSLAHRPDVVLADEPTGALDSASSELVLQLMQGQVMANGTTFVLVTHDPKVAAAADRVLNMHDGRLTQETDE
jgi:putative ABC transport system ATP-binding protein